MRRATRPDLDGRRHAARGAARLRVAADDGEDAEDDSVDASSVARCNAF